MYVSNREGPHDLPVMSVEDFRTHQTLAVLEELLTRTLPLRDLYKGARCQSADVHSRHLHALFNTHYKEQLNLVDVLVDRIRALGGASRVLAGAFLLGTPPSYALRGYSAINRLLCDLLDAHEIVLSAAQTADTHGLQADPSAIHDFAVGQVVLTNDLQRGSVGEQLVRLDQARKFVISNIIGADAYE